MNAALGNPCFLISAVCAAVLLIVAVLISKKETKQEEERTALGPRGGTFIVRMPLSFIVGVWSAIPFCIALFSYIRTGYALADIWDSFGVPIVALIACCFAFDLYALRFKLLVGDHITYTPFWGSSKIIEFQEIESAEIKDSMFTLNLTQDRKLNLLKTTIFFKLFLLVLKERKISVK